MDLAEFLNARLDEDRTSATPGRRQLDDLRFDLKRGDPYEQHLSSRIEDGLDSQTMVWEARVRREVEAKQKIVAAYEAALHAAAAYKDSGEPEPEWHIMRRTAFEFSCSVLARVYPGYEQR